ncbi:MAG TPA: lysozyme [Candidatus Sulfotelmatobacter sp.]|jgi:lysozyme
MEHSQVATKLVQQFEGCRLTAYRDGNGIPTIGWGHTQGVKMGDVWTQQQADDELDADLGHFDLALQIAVGVPLNQHQWDALISFIYNIGPGNFENSTARRLLLSKDYLGASNAMLMWNKIDGKVSDGLVRRRLAEKSLFDTPMEEL